MPEEKKLGPGVTYMNPDKSSKLVTMAGVLFKEGQSVNLVEKLGEARSKDILKKLSGNRFFRVDGGPDHEKEAEDAVTGGDSAIADHAVAEEARIRASEGDEAADKYVDSLDEDGVAPAPKAATGRSAGGAKMGVPPDSVQTPDQMTLETQPAPRRPTRS